MELSPKLLVVEGFDGCGKTILSKWIAKNYGYRYCKSPGGAFKNARSIFDFENIPVEERFSFYLGECIRASMEAKKLVESGEKVIYDRYYYSTIVYHEAIKKGITNDYLYIFNNLLKPDLILFIKVDYNKIIERTRNRINSLNDKMFINHAMYDRITYNYLRIFNVKTIVIENNGSLIKTKNVISSHLKLINYSSNE